MPGLPSSQTLRRREPVQAVLIHGLFSNGAFWIPYLGSFANFQVTLVSVDYAAHLQAGTPLRELAGHVDRLVGDKPAHLIGHSFGCWLSLYLKSNFLSRSFICPTFAAFEFDAAAFCSEISQRTTVEQAAIAPLVESAIGYKARHRRDLRSRASDNFYLPCDDPYFRYVERLDEGTTYGYRGGHFDVSGAVDMISDKLLPDS